MLREWGRMAVTPYAAGAAVGWWLWRREASPRARVWLAVGMFVFAALIPLAMETAWRAQTAPGLHAQSEVLVTEEAAKALVDGRDPYATTFLHGSLAARPFATKTHFPYAPAMTVFGLPRAAGAPGPLSDARVWFALATVGIGGLALRWWPGGTDERLRAAQVLFVLPTGALLLATGGDDLPVLALMALGLVLLARERYGWAGVALGLAGALKQTAWPMVAVAAVLLWPDRGRWGRFVGASLGVAALVLVPFAAWNPAAFFEDVVRFPLGVGRERSAAGTPTAGSSLLRWVPGGRGVAVVLLGVVVIAVAVWIVRHTNDRGPAGVARATGWILAAAFVLSPSARFGYVVYPVNLLVWAAMLPAPADALR